ncbi:MAG: dihydrolipoyllysine-residue acetyltransferase [Pseudomonadales bacterium]|nr:dihydrolipoyllysine-residue acetyltransferase [Pseudomonadales bacterium]
METIKVPDLGGVDDVEVIEISVAEGESIREEQTLIVLESDKATMEVPSPVSGLVKSLLLKVGDKVSMGSPILTVLDNETSVDQAPQDQAAQEMMPSEAEVVNTENKKGSPEKTVERDVSLPTTTAPPKVDEAVVPAEQTASTIIEPEMETVVVPDLGGVDSAVVIEVLVERGQAVEVEQSLIVLESDKASMEVPSPFAGVVDVIRVSSGDSISQGDPILVLKKAASGRQAENTPKSGVVREASEQGRAVANHTVDPLRSEQFIAAPGEQNTAMPDILDEGDLAFHRERQARMVLDQQLQAAAQQKQQQAGRFYAGPSVRKLARQLGVDLAQVKASGPRSRVLKEDVHAYVKQRLAATAQPSASAIPEMPFIDFSRFGEVEAVALTRIEQLTANNMHRNWLNVPHVTQFDEADMTAIDNFRKDMKTEMEKRGQKLTPIVFLLKACASALREFPKFNSSLDQQCRHLVYKKYIHIGVAVDTPAGLMVPVIRDVDEKGLWELSSELRDLSLRAREGKLKPAEMQGGCFTISSLGAIGGQGFTPIVNAPEVAILGVSRAQIKPVWNGKEFVAQNSLPLSLSYDHRVINGGDAGRFFTFLLEEIADLRRMLL